MEAKNAEIDRQQRELQTVRVCSCRIVVHLQQLSWLTEWYVNIFVGRGGCQNCPDSATTPRERCRNRPTDEGRILHTVNTLGNRVRIGFTFPCTQNPTTSESMAAVWSPPQKLQVSQPLTFR